MKDTIATPGVPALKADIRVGPFSEARRATARYLVEIEHRQFAVSERLYHVVQALLERPASYDELRASVERRWGVRAGEAAVRTAVERLPRDLFEGEPLPAQRFPFVVRRRVLPATAAAALSSRLTWLYARPVVAFATAAFAVVIALLGQRAFAYPHFSLTMQSGLVLYALLLGSLFFHELGHAAAVRRYDCEHGEIGVALYLIYPAFYTDVTKAWRLPKNARAVVDAGGIYFQSMFATAAGAVALVTHDAALQFFVVATVFSMLYTLNPFFKMDGYWLLSDLGGLTNLHASMADAYVTLARRWLGRAPDARSHAAAHTAILAGYGALAIAYFAFIAYYVGLYAVASAAGLPQRFGSALAGHAWGELAGVVLVPSIVWGAVAAIAVRTVWWSRPFVKRLLA